MSSFLTSVINENGSTVARQRSHKMSW